jgi:hypothetical protein
MYLFLHDVVPVRLPSAYEETFLVQSKENCAKSAPRFRNSNLNKNGSVALTLSAFFQNT